MKMPMTFVSRIVCAELLVCCFVAHATTLEAMNLARMSHVAKAIVRARCASNASSWDGDEIWTFTTFEILESWKGSPPETISVRLLGGTVGGIRSNVGGVPRFRPGEEVVLFLEPTSRGDFSVVSWQLGTFRIHHDPRSGEERVTQDTAAIATFDPRTRRFEANGVRNLPLAVLREHVRTALAQRAEAIR